MRYDTYRYSSTGTCDAVLTCAFPSIALWTTPVNRHDVHGHIDVGYDVSMAYPAMAPNATQMRGYLALGLTQQQIADRYEEDSGVKVSRSAIGLAIARYGLESTTPRPRHDDLIPWTVAPEHRNHRDVKMLRLEARRRKGLPLTEKQLRWLTTWLGELQDNDAVVMYNPATSRGFFWVRRRDADGDDPIRRPENVGA